MSIKTAIRNLKADVPGLKLHLKESREGIRLLEADLYGDVEDLKTQLYIAQINAKDALKEEKSWARGVTMQYLKTHAKGLLAGIGADLKRGFKAVVLGLRIAWAFPFALAVWALLLVSAFLVSVATFSLTEGKDFLEDFTG